MYTTDNFPGLTLLILLLSFWGLALLASPLPSFVLGPFLIWTLILYLWVSVWSRSLSSTWSGLIKMSLFASKSELEDTRVWAVWHLCSVWFATVLTDLKGFIGESSDSEKSYSWDNVLPAMVNFSPLSSSIVFFTSSRTFWQLHFRSIRTQSSDKWPLLSSWFELHFMLNLLTCSLFNS